MSKQTAKDNIVLETLEVVYINPEELNPNKYNPNRQSEKEFELLCRSMEEDGFTQPIVVREKDNVIVDGEHRWRAAQSIGLKEIPVVFVNMGEAQMRIATLRHNRARGSENVELAADVLRDLVKLGVIDEAADSLMLDNSEIDKLVNEINEPEQIEIEGAEAASDPFKFIDSEGETIMKESHQVVSSTAAASDAMRLQRDSIEKAKQDEDARVFQQEEQKLYKLTLAFIDDEADLMRKFLGHSPAENILNLCRAAKGYN